MAVEYDGGVIIGADSRTTTGYFYYFICLFGLSTYCYQYCEPVSIIL